MPPPSFFQQLFDQNAIVTFLNIGPEDSFPISDGNEVRSIDNFFEFITDKS